MFGTSIHWTTFFYLLINTIIIIIAVVQCLKLKRLSLKRYIILGLLYIAYNLTGGFLPMANFPGPDILQYIITYGVAIALCIYMIYYFYKEYDIVFLKFHASIRNIAILATSSFVLLFLLPYFFTNSLESARFLFTVPISVVAFIFLGLFYKRISHSKNPNPFILRRNKLSLLSVSCIAFLPVLTVIGDYQWLTFTVMNLAFYLITAIEIDRYLYFIENKPIYDLLSIRENHLKDPIPSKIIFQNLTRREIEIALSILGDSSYKEIAKDLFIAESTVSKHASNIYKKIGVKNREQFLSRFPKNED